jgi:hypothetical protein
MQSIINNDGLSLSDLGQFLQQVHLMQSIINNDGLSLSDLGLMHY